MHDILTHIDAFDFFSALKKLDKLVGDDANYLQLKKAFNHGKYATDFPARLRAFVLTLGTNEAPKAETEQPITGSKSVHQPALSGIQTILFLCSNPKDTELLSVNKEYNEIQNERRGFEKQFDVEIVLDVNIDNLSRFLNQYQPSVIQFSGHGDNDGLFFYNESGYSEEIAITAFAKMLRHYPSIELVFMNACYSGNQAATVAQYVPYVIGIQGAIHDDKAILFSTRFYRHLFAGCNYADAFFRACDEIALYNLPLQFEFYQQGNRVQQ